MTTPLRTAILGASSVSPFVRRSVSQIALPRDALVLDMPCGYGRHAIWLARQGYRVIAADRDGERVKATHLTRSALSWPPQLSCVIADCENDFPFCDAIFDAIFIIHYYSDQILDRARGSLKRNGYLIFETFGAQGRNWQSLPEIGTASRVIGTDFQPLYLKERRCGPNGDRAVVRALAKKIR